MTNYHDYSAADKQELRPRRLPPVPRAARTKSRPLPQVPRPRALACKECNTCITSSRSILSPSAVSIELFPLPELPSNDLPDSWRFPIIQRVRRESVAVHRNVRLFLFNRPFTLILVADIM